MGLSEAEQYIFNLLRYSAIEEGNTSTLEGWTTPVGKPSSGDCVVTFHGGDITIDCCKYALFYLDSVPV